MTEHRRFFEIVSDYQRTWFPQGWPSMPTSEAELAEEFWVQFDEMSDVQVSDLDVIETWPPRAQPGPVEDYPTWAGELVARILSFESTEDIKAVLVQLLRKADSDEKRQYLGAGPIEDLMFERGIEILPLFDQLIDSTPRVTECLRSVWISSELEPAVVSWFRAKGFNVAGADLN